jgi:hypothetical protein
MHTSFSSHLTSKNINIAHSRRCEFRRPQPESAVDRVSSYDEGALRMCLTDRLADGPNFSRDRTKSPTRGSAVLSEHNRIHLTGRRDLQQSCH